MLREKIVASASANMIVIADGSKEVATLGRFPLPIEVVPFGLEATRRAILKVFGDLGLPLNMALRGGSAQPFVTDGGHFILDAQLESIPEVQTLGDRLVAIPGLSNTASSLNLQQKLTWPAQMG